MISSVRQAEIVQQVCDVLDENGEAIGGLPINPFKIAQRAGLTVKSWKPDAEGVSGVLMKVGNQFLIAHSEAISNAGFMNFTVAHELGHYYLSGHIEAVLNSGVHYSRSGFVSDERFEREADVFAAELLMPRGWFRDAMRTAGEGFSAVESLAKKCATSIVATAIRYAQLTEVPMAVIVSSGSTIDYCFMSDGLKEYRMKWIERGNPVPKDSATGSFNRDVENVVSGRQRKLESSLRLWFENAPDIEMKEDVVGLGHYGKTLTVLFADDSAELEEGEEEEDTYSNLPSMRWRRREF